MEVGADVPRRQLTNGGPCLFESLMSTRTHVSQSSFREAPGDVVDRPSTRANGHREDAFRSVEGVGVNWPMLAGFIAVTITAVVVPGPTTALVVRGPPPGGFAAPRHC